MKIKRFLALLMCTIIFMTSCSGDVIDPIVTDPGVEYPTEEMTEAETHVSLAGYKVVRAEKASGTVVSAAMELRKTLEAVAGNITISDDWLKSGEELPAEALEILVGDTNRPESIEVKKELLSDDFAVKYFPESKRIVICGGSDAATLKAIGHFLEFCLSGSEIESSLSFFSAGQYAVTECLLSGVPIEKYLLVLPDNADADEKYAAELIRDRVIEKTGKSIESVKASAAPAGNLILVGNTSKTPAEFTSLKGSEAGYVLGMKDGNLILCGDGGLVVKAAREFINALFPKGEEKVSLEPEDAKIIAYAKASYPALDDFGTKPIALADQLNASIAVYDLSTGREPIFKYEFKPKTAKGFSLVGYGNRVDEARLRYSEKWGTYIICFTSSSGYVGVAGYPSEDCLWEVELKGTSPHSIEYLPSGMIAVASSGGSDTSKGFIRLYSTEKKNNNHYAEAQLTSAHAVLWDETREVLWAMGSSDIVAYEIGDDPANPTLTKIAAYGCKDMKGGHDLSAICGNDDQVWVGGSIIRVFDKTTGKLISNFDGEYQIDSGNVKCICSFPDGTAARTVATGVYASHNTDRFNLYEFHGGVALAVGYIFEGRAFYKARAFLADYN